MRIPIAADLESRDGSLRKDAFVKNALIEVAGQDENGPILKLRKRPGVVLVGTIKVGTAQLLYSWNGLQAIIGDYLNSGTVSSIVSAPVQVNLAATNPNLPFTAQETSNEAATPRLMFKNRTQAWTLNRAGTVAAVVYGGSMGSETFNVSSLTRSGGTATATFATDPGFHVDDSVTIAGAAQPAYNGTFSVTAATPASFTPERDITISSLTRVSTLATAVATAHGLTNGSSYAISGANQSGYNGTFAVTVVDANTFTYTVTLSGSGPDQAVPVTITRSGTTATATSTAAHGLSSGTYTLSGATQSQYNGSKAITVTGANTFTFTVTVTAESPASPATGSPAYVGPSITMLSYTNGGSGNLFSCQADNIDQGTAAQPYAFVTGMTITVEAGDPNIAAGNYVISAVTGGSTRFPSFTITVPGTVGSVSGGNTPFFHVPHATVSSVTRSGTTATVTTSAAHHLLTGATSMMSGATQSAYNIQAPVSVTASNRFTYTVAVTAESPVSPATGSTQVNGKDPQTPATGAIKVVDPAVTVLPSFTYTVAGSPATPATGTITAQGAGGTVPGIPYINGYFFVMDSNGVIWNSALDDPTSWDSLAFIIAQSVNGAGRALTQSGNYLVALKEWSAEYFYDAKKSPGSPLDLVSPAFADIGCASGDSAIRVNGVPIWISQTREQPGRAVHILQGLTPVKVSTLSVERILDADDLVNVMAMPSNFDGHPVYIVTLPTSNVTLMYDFNSKTWGTMTALNAGSPKSVSSITFDNSDDIATATVNAPGHGFSDGDPVTIAGADQPEYNGTFPAVIVDANTFTVLIPGNPGSSATGTITATGYTESTLPASKIASHLGAQFALHNTAGLLLQLSTTVYKDAAAPIDTFARSQRLDGGTLKKKKMPHLRVVADSVDDIVLVRWSDDDCATYSSYQRVDLSEDQPELRKCGQFRRRALEMRHTGNNQINLLAYEPDIG